MAPSVAITRLSDGAHALEFLFCRGRYWHLEPLAPHLILLDLELPVLSGFEVLSALRGHPHTKAAPIIAFTSTFDPHAIERSYTLGASGYIVKPIDRSNYVTEVEGIVERWIKT